MTQSSDIVQAPPSPTFAEIGSTLRVLDGEPVKRVRDLMNTIFDQAGSAPSSLDWSDPERWIDERLTGDLRALARKVWEGSGKALNPRHLYAQVVFINRLRLLEPVDGAYRLGERGRRFLSGDEAILRELVALRSSKRGGARRSSGQGRAKNPERGASKPISG
jgi:restriction system protein